MKEGKGAELQKLYKEFMKRYGDAGAPVNKEAVKAEMAIYAAAAKSRGALPSECELEYGHVVSAYGELMEMQGFGYGFRHAVNIIMACTDAENGA